MNEDAYEKMPIVCKLDAKSTTGWVLRRDFANSERFFRAAKVAIIFLVCTLVSALLPILHFVLVPIFLVLTLLGTASVLLEKGEILRGEVACPECGEMIPFPKKAESWPKKQRCPKCSFLLTFEPPKKT